MAHGWLVYFIDTRTLGVGFTPAITPNFALMIQNSMHNIDERQTNTKQNVVTCHIDLCVKGENMII